MSIPRSKSATIVNKSVTLPVRRSSNSHSSVILKEGWMTVYAKKTKLFHRYAGRSMHRCWAVVRQDVQYDVRLDIVFYQDNIRETKSSNIKMFKIDPTPENVTTSLLITKMVENPDKYANSMVLKFKKESIMCCFDNKTELEQWLNTLCDFFKIEYKLEMIYWEWHDESGLWQAFCNDVRKSIEVNYLDQMNTFTLGDPELSHHYNLATLSRTHPRSKITQRLKRTASIWDRPEALRVELSDLLAIWEWESEGGIWHPYEREVNQRIEQLYQSSEGKWMQLTMCTPSPTSILLDLHHMRQINPRTGARRTLRRITDKPNRSHPKLGRRNTSLSISPSVTVSMTVCCVVMCYHNNCMEYCDRLP